MLRFDAWHDVPGTLQSRSALHKKGLEPLSPPVAQVFANSNRWIDLYDTRDTRAKPTPADAAPVQARLRELLARDDVLILDTETTGLAGAEVVEVSVIDTCGRVRLDTLIRPKVARMNPYAQRLHGISLEMLDNQPTWPEVLPELVRLTERATVLAWNAPFDANMLTASSAVWELSHPCILFACAMRLYAQCRGKQTGLHKAVVAEGLAGLLAQHQSHRALGDVNLTLAVLRASAA